ncbi:MAG: DUF433 domain-containing protein [Planctomycetaceae bacterium]|nr:DUF433 domain-containing protein [Planctomycetaceae bacterium]
MQVRWQDRLVSTPGVLCGKPRLKGTRLSVSFILGHLASGSTIDDMCTEYPGLSAEDIAACLAFARDLTDNVAASDTTTQNHRQ